MTRKEWMIENRSAWVADCYTGGVCGCPNHYPSLMEIDPTIKDEDVVRCSGDNSEECEACWSKEIPNTRKEKNMENERLYNEHLEKAGGCETANPVYKTEAAPTHKESGVAPGILIDDDLTYRYPSEETPHILDSGNRREFESGAVRDIQEGKGRCDLLPLDVVSKLLNDEFFNYIDHFRNDGDVSSLYKALNYFSVRFWMDKNDPVDGQRYHRTIAYAEICLEVAKHFEEGCKKYGENNWRKGIPVHCYIDSAVRHYLKYLRGDKDEPHDRAFVWNIMCAIWTCDHMPELNEYKKETK